MMCIVRKDDHKLLQESYLTVWQPSRCPLHYINTVEKLFFYYLVALRIVSCLHVNSITSGWRRNILSGMRIGRFRWTWNMSSVTRLSTSDQSWSCARVGKRLCLLSKNSITSSRLSWVSWFCAYFCVNSGVTLVNSSLNPKFNAVLEYISSLSRISDVNWKPVLFLRQPVFKFILLSFSSRKLHTNYQMSDKINSRISVMLSVCKSFHQKVKETIYYKI